uniref:Uncharacterized protein n=1 Tax=Rhizophora mucronata TaxID=61149 RepID=A0A2P2QE32_RHIMU
MLMQKKSPIICNKLCTKLL